MNGPQSFHIPDGFVNAARRLTRREFQTLLGIAAGKSNQEIATERGTGIETIKTQLKGLYRKLDVRNRTEAVIYAYENGIVTPGYASGPQQQVAMAWAEVVRSAPPPEKSLESDGALSDVFESLELKPLQRKRALKWAARMDEGMRIIKGGFESIERQLKVAGFMARNESLPEGLSVELTRVLHKEPSPQFD